jgi:aminoglycoside phosphotransferase family enzyme/predicted kinase
MEPPATEDAAAQARNVKALVRFLTDRRGRVERIDTHGAIVLLAGNRAYKLKRSVKYPYMDFSTPTLRFRFCRRELDVNRRTAPDLYLRLLSVVPGRRSGVRLGGASDRNALDWVVEMRRFEQENLFDRLAITGNLTPDLARRLADAVVEFHRSAAVVRRGDVVAEVRRLIVTNDERLREHPGLFDDASRRRLRRLALGWLQRDKGMLRRRFRAGRVRVCHGDLHLRNVALIDGRPTLFDAIEFNDDFVRIDVLYDLAFLLMDLDHRHRGPLAQIVLDRYMALTEDYAGLGLLPLFLSTRAAVRAHVGATAAHQVADVADRRRRRREARAYLELALAYLRPPRPRLVAVGGLSGTGKSTLAYRLAPRIAPRPGAVVLRSDWIRKRLTGVAETARLGEAGYRPSVTRRVFARLSRLAAAALRSGHSAIADAVFGQSAQRRSIRAVARRFGAEFHGIWLDAPIDVLVERVTARHGDVSDATAEVVRAQSRHIEPPTDWRTVDAGGDIDRVLRRVVGAVSVWRD